MKPIFFHPAAVEELEHSVKFYEACRTGLGDDFLQEVRTVVARISDHPLIGAPYKDMNLRHLVLRRFPFVVFYLDQSDAIWIVAVAHGSRKPDYWSDRLLDDPDAPA